MDCRERQPLAGMPAFLIKLYLHNRLCRFTKIANRRFCDNKDRRLKVAGSPKNSRCYNAPHE